MLQKHAIYYIMIYYLSGVINLLPKDEPFSIIAATRMLDSSYNTWKISPAPLDL